jgi:hypothetical protein
MKKAHALTPNQVVFQQWKMRVGSDGKRVLKQSGLSGVRWRTRIYFERCPSRLVWHQRTLFILHLSIMAGWLSWANKKDSSGGGMPVELLMTLNFATRVRQVWAKWYYRALEIANTARMQSKQNPPEDSVAQWKTLLCQLISSICRRNFPWIGSGVAKLKFQTASGEKVKYLYLYIVCLCGSEFSKLYFKTCALF